ncbi:MAG TPA: DUF4783 domain-containing protein [Mucilaginibacter sp.]|nr:DUF4783 domain-containing protein [Mucilaginibacter sp.]
MKLLYLPMLVALYMLPVSAGPIEKVAEYMRQGNVNELSKLLATNVEMTVQGEENIYSKVQAGLILEKFFHENKPVSVNVLHKINSNPSYLFGVLILNTQKGAFRVAFTLRQTDGGLSMIELRIETEKVK